MPRNPCLPKNSLSFRTLILQKMQCITGDEDLMRERFAKLLLGEDMSGSGGMSLYSCYSLKLSNQSLWFGHHLLLLFLLCSGSSRAHHKQSTVYGLFAATVFEQSLILHPLSTEKKGVTETMTGGLTHSKSSLDMMKDIGGDEERGNDKNHILPARARRLLFV